jgi:hypothetical protein
MHKDSTLVTNCLRILGVLVGFQDFATHFLDETLFQGMTHIDDLPLLGDTQVALDILFSCVICQPFYFTQTIYIFSSFLFFLAGFDNKVM